MTSATPSLAAILVLAVLGLELAINGTPLNKDPVSPAITQNDKPVTSLHFETNDETVRAGIVLGEGTVSLQQRRPSGASAATPRSPRPDSQDDA